MGEPMMSFGSKSVDSSVVSMSAPEKSAGADAARTVSAPRSVVRSMTLFIVVVFELYIEDDWTSMCKCVTSSFLCVVYSIMHSCKSRSSRNVMTDERNGTMGQFFFVGHP